MSVLANLPVDRVYIAWWMTARWHESKTHRLSGAADAGGCETICGRTAPYSSLYAKRVVDHEGLAPHVDLWWRPCRACGVSELEAHDRCPGVTCKLCAERIMAEAHRRRVHRMHMALMNVPFPGGASRLTSPI